MRAALVLVALAACAKEPAPTPPRKTATKSAQPIVRNPKHQPRWVEFDHIFITFKDHERFGQLRSREEAGELARKIHDWVTSGTSWDLLKEKYSDDRAKTGRANGPYILVNDGLRHRPGQIPRGEYAKLVGDLCFAMKVGEIRLAEYHPKDCQFGWHVVKRVK